MKQPNEKKKTTYCSIQINYNGSMKKNSSTQEPILSYQDEVTPIVAYKKKKEREEEQKYIVFTIQ